jgi:hypothetical protein
MSPPSCSESHHAEEPPSVGALRPGRRPCCGAAGAGRRLEGPPPGERRVDPAHAGDGGEAPCGRDQRPTRRRLYAAEGLDRQTLKLSDREPRRRWEAHAPNVLWHTDVCHGPTLRIDGRAVPLRIHALRDDHSLKAVDRELVEAAATGD